jgi:glycosyltransferase involved in cell wall biosynthesis
MKIAYVSTDFGVPIFGYKGASRHVREVVGAFSAGGHSVCVLSPAMSEGTNAEGQSNFGEDAARQAGGVAALAAAFPSLAQVEFVTVPPADRHLEVLGDLLEVDGFLGRRTSIRQELRSLFYNHSFAERALDELRARSVEFIYERYAAFSWAGIRLARALGIRHLLEVNAPLALEHQKRRGLELVHLARDAERQIWLETDHVLVVSKELQDVVVSSGVPAERVSVLPNAVDPHRFSPERTQAVPALRGRYGLDGKRVIGFVGTLKPWHGVHTLIDAFRDLHRAVPRTHLLLVGDGPERQALERRVGDLGLGEAVSFTGNVAPDEVPDFIAAMDIAVAPYVPSENFYYSPLKIFEYMSMAKPVVAGNIGQVSELLSHDDTGMLYEPGRIDQLAHALARLANDPALCEHVGRRARAFILREHSWERNAERLVALAARLGAQARTPAGGRHS